MPWEVSPVSEIRLAFVHQVESLHYSVTQACADFGISRKTGYKWLSRYRVCPEEPLEDRSRRPRSSPSATPETVEKAILRVRSKYGWGARKIRAFLIGKVPKLPSIKTVGNVLRRHGCIDRRRAEPEKPQFFERAAPHQLWQCDHKGPVEVARQKIHPLTVIDDHSRYLLALKPCTDLTMKTAFGVLWRAFGEFGLPESLLCDNAFGTTREVPKTLSWFDAQLVRLGIRPLHGRPYHPQTQGKVERLHGTLEREVWPYVRHDCLRHFEEDVDRWRTEVYNPLRPHEALGDQPPLSRFRPSPRPRPGCMPKIEYPAGSITRKVSSVGDIRWHRCRILAGNGLIGEYVRIEERDHEVAIYYGWKQIRSIPHDQLKSDKML